MKKYSVFQSPLAEKKLFILLDYLDAEWGQNSKTRFINKFQLAIKSLEVVPRSFPVVDHSRYIHKCVITKQSSLFYRIVNDEVEIITLIDNRQDQRKLFDELKEHFNIQNM